MTMISESFLPVGKTALMDSSQDSIWISPSVEVPEAKQDLFEWFWVVVVLVFAMAIAYATYCTSQHGNPTIKAGWRGFTIKCTGQ